ncbi:MAG: phosphodiesterase [Planktomarina sp.]|nr:phosphodiesterase [Planktomarina sp.]|tara:strand:- start:130 stop:936 length:807 start_codon:yes stop_codon:yes gene_type:complete
MTKIIQISDPHIVAKGKLAYGQVDTCLALTQCVAQINKILPEIGPVDMIIVTGDLTDFGTSDEYSLFRELIEELRIPYRAIPGNHDDKSVMQKCFADADWMPKTGPINWQIDFEDLKVIGLDTSIIGKAHGNLETDSLNFLRSSLNSAKGKPVIVASHHPPIITGIEKMDIQNLRDSDELKEILSTYQGELKLICGHIHRNIVTQFGNVICQIAPGVSHAVTIDLRKGSPNCLTKEPGSFLLHEIRDGILTHQIPVDDYDGPYLFYPE